MHDILSYWIQCCIQYRTVESFYRICTSYWLCDSNELHEILWHIYRSEPLTSNAQVNFNLTRILLKSFSQCKNFNFRSNFNISKNTGHFNLIQNFRRKKNVDTKNRLFLANDVKWFSFWNFQFKTKSHKRTKETIECVHWMSLISLARAKIKEKEIKWWLECEWVSAAKRKLKLNKLLQWCIMQKFIIIRLNFSVWDGSHTETQSAAGNSSNHLVYTQTLIWQYNLNLLIDEYNVCDSCLCLYVFRKVSSSFIQRMCPLLW